MNISALRKIFKHSLLAQWTLFCLIFFAIGCLNVFYMVRQYGNTEIQENTRLRELVGVIDRNIDFQLDATSKVLVQIRKDLTSHGGYSDLYDISNRLRIICDAMTGIRTIIITDAEGTVLASNKIFLIGRNFRVREYFTAPFQKPDPEILYISSPFTSFSGVYVMNLTHVIQGPGGRFSGVITASIDPEYFKIILSSVLYAPDMWSSIAHGDGIQFLMVPEREGQPGKNLAQPDSLFTRHIESGMRNNVFTGTAYATGEERMMAVQTITPGHIKIDKPLVVAVGRELKSLFSSWRREATVQGLLFSMLAIAGALGLLFYQRRYMALARRAIEVTEELKASEDRYRLIAENTSDVVWQIDLQSKKFTYVSPSILQLRGYTPEEVMAQPLEASLTPDSLKKVELSIRDTLADLRMGKTDRIYHIIQVEQPCKDGTAVWTEAATTYILDADKRPVSIVGISRDISERKKMEDSIRNSLMEKEMLIREIHHRVKNNMTIISSLLTLQEQNIENEGMIKIFQESQQRIRSMSLVHEKLYNSGDLKKINFHEYITTIISELMHAFNKTGNGIRIGIEASDIELDIDRAIPCGLIINELITNSFKYAFHDMDGGELTVSFVRWENSFVLKVKDNGPGLPEKFNSSELNTLGLQLVTVLAGQLKGAFNIRSENGTEAVVTFSTESN